MRKKTNPDSIAKDQPLEAVEQPKTKSSRTKKPAVATEPLTQGKDPVIKAGKKPVAKKTASKSSEIELTPSVSPNSDSAKPKPVAKKVAAPKRVVAPVPATEAPVIKSTPLFGRSKPDALKSLAELVEEEKLNPRPRKPKPAPLPKVEPPVAIAPNEPKAVESRQNPRDRRSSKPPRNDRAPLEKPTIAVTPLEEMSSETIGEWQVYWRPSQGVARPQNRGNRHKQKPAITEAPIETRKPKGRPARSSEPAEVVLTESQAFGDEELQVQFRKRADGAAPARSTDREPRRRREQAPVQVEAPPPVPIRPSIPIPVDAPQVVLRNGLPTLVRDHVVFPPIGFFGSAPDEKRANTLFAEIRRAAEAGVHLHSILVEFEVDAASVGASVNYAAYMTSKIIEIDPQAQIIYRIVFGAPRNWGDRYPDAKFTTKAGRQADPSICDSEFWNQASECLAEFVKRIRQHELHPHAMGVHLDRGEWFYPEGYGYDSSKSATLAFRDWLRTRYVNDVVALRAAWFDGAATFDTIQVPEFRTSPEGSDFMRISRRERRWVDYHLFLSDATCHRIAELAYTAKEASEGYFLVGVSYGYTFEWSHPASGHLSLGKLLRTREIDFIAGPPSYRSREPGGDAPFPCPIDSLALNGKLYLSEEDFKTAIGDHKEPDDYNPVVKTPQALEALHWRGAGAALTHGSGMFWMDLWGNGWLNTATIWDRGTHVIETLVKRMATSSPDPDVAVFIDERALGYLVDEHSFALLVQDVRESVLRSGLSAGFYLLSDLAHRENFPECKLYIFLNAWDIRPEHRHAIKNRLQKDGKVLFWLYCAGMFDNGRESLERAREVTGIAIKPQPFHSRTGTTILSKRHPLCEAFAGQGLIGGAHVDPSYFAIPENATVLGEYSQSGLPSFVIRDFNEDPDPAKHWKSVFLGEPFVTPGLLRALAQIAGCHIWNYHSDVVHVRPPFLAVHCTGAGQRAIALPRNWEAYNLLQRTWATEESNTVRFQGIDGATHLFLVGDRHEIEQLIAVDPETWLRMEQIPERADESSPDAMTFDVPIMRLDEVFGETPDDVGDEWFLKPGMIEIEETTVRESKEVENKVVRRRRQRPDRKRDDRSTGETFDTELGMSVMFRKRE